MYEKPNHQSTCHKQQREGKQWINLTYNLIDWQHGGNDVVTEDDGNPHNGIACY